MEKTSCLIDATTLVEHIHEIKSWIYNGQLRLVVPLTTCERIEQLSQDLKEQPIKRPDPPRHRLSCKTQRKDYPAFNINLRVVQEFLARLGLEKAEHLITFQLPSEEYSPWKGVGVHVVKKVSNGDGPTTWAQAALTSLNNKVDMVNTAGNSVGPLKPKLVARVTGTEMQPWKTNKKAPRTPPSAVPDAHRPLLSYALWRLYENVVTRTDKNQSTILTANPELYDIARKLDINVQRIVEFRHLVSAQKLAIDLNVFGDLEREFGTRPPKALVRQNEKIEVKSGGDYLLDRNGHHIKVKGKEVDEIEASGQYLDTEGRQDDNLETIKKERDGNEIELHVNGDTHEPDNESSIADLEEQTTTEDASESISSAPPEVSVIVEKPELLIAELPKATSSEVENSSVAPQPAFVSGETSLTQSNEGIDIGDIVATQSKPTTDFDLRPATRSLVDKTVDENAVTNGDAPVYLDGSLQIQSTPLSKLQSQPQHCTKKSISTSRQSSNVSSPAATQISVEPEDSDEEVVVFNPKMKRMSANQKSLKQFSPRQTNHANNFQQVPQVKTTIIDPDAFGRSFATNTRGYIPNGQRARNSPRGSPRRGPRMNEPEVDYILKSGTTREASRGQGKLWVP